MMVISLGLFCCFFFFKQKTAYEMRISDWSSDVCSSDLPLYRDVPAHHQACCAAISRPRRQAAPVPRAMEVQSQRRAIVGPWRAGAANAAASAHQANPSNADRKSVE